MPLAVVPRPSVNVWHVPCAKRLRSRGAFFCRDRPAAERRHNDSTPHGSAAIAGSSPALRFPWLIGGAVVFVGSILAVLFLLFAARERASMLWGISAFLANVACFSTFFAGIP